MTSRRLRTPFKQRPLRLVPKARGGYQGLLMHVWLPTGWSLCSRRRYDQRASQDQSLRQGVRLCSQCMLIATSLSNEAEDIMLWASDNGIIPDMEEIEFEMGMLNRRTVHRVPWNMRLR